MLSEIDGYLIHWARWAIYRADAGLGFSRSTTLGRVIELGPAGAAIRQGQARVIPSNETAERLDHLIAGLPDHLGQIIKLEYLGRDSRAQHAKRLHLGVDAFRYRLRSAKAQLAAALCHFSLR